MAAPAQTKVLRIGVIQGGKIIEERLLKRRETVTIGQDPKNTIVIPVSNLPQSFPLFELKGNDYQLGFDEKMDGRVSLTDAAAVDFAALRSSGQARPKGPGTFAVPLPDSARGKVQIGEVTVLFQFVTPPPEAPKPVLPVAARGGVAGFFSGIDKLFTGLLVASMTTFYTAVLIISQREVNEDVRLEEIPDRLVKMIMPERPVEMPKEEAKTEVAEAKPAKEEPKAAAKEEPASGEAKAAAAKAKMESTVSKSGLLAVIGSDGDGGGALDDVLGTGSGPADVAEALSGASRVGVATADSIGTQTRGGGTGTAAGIGDLATSGGGNVGLGEKKEAAVVAKVETMGGPEVESSSVDRNAVAKFVKARIKAVASCYEKELKRNPSLKGKVVVRFTITASGRVSEVEIEENSLGNQAVASCIRTIVRGWAFPFKPEEDVPVSYPFVFSPSSG